MVISFLFFLVQTNIRENVVLSAPHTCEVSSVGPGLPTTQRPSLCQSADKTTPISSTNNVNMFQNGIFLRVDFCIHLPLWGHWNTVSIQNYQNPVKLRKINIKRVFSGDILFSLFLPFLLNMSFIRNCQF